MTKTKASASSAKASASPNKESAAVLIVMGYDEHHKPCAARFTGADPNLVAKAAKLMDLEVREASSEDLAAVAKKLPVGRLYGNGRGFVPNIRQDLYSEVVVALSDEPQGGPAPVQEAMPVASGLPPDLGRDHDRPSGDRPGDPGPGLVGGHRDRPQRRHVHVAVSRLPQDTQVHSPSQRHRPDEPARRIGAEHACGPERRQSVRALSHHSSTFSHRKSGASVMETKTAQIRALNDAIVNIWSAAWRS
jgi:hypothetical protein